MDMAGVYVARMDKVVSPDTLGRSTVRKHIDSDASAGERGHECGPHNHQRAPYRRSSLSLTGLASCT